MGERYFGGWDSTPTVAVDYDGTLEKNNGGLCRWLINLLKWEQHNGACIVLWSCREGEMLQDAVDALRRVMFVPDFVNEGSPKRPASRKVNADVYIDDRSSIAYAALKSFFIVWRAKCKTLTEYRESVSKKT